MDCTSSDWRFANCPLVHHLDNVRIARGTPRRIVVAARRVRAKNRCRVLIWRIRAGQFRAELKTLIRRLYDPASVRKLRGFRVARHGWLSARYFMEKTTRSRRRFVKRAIITRVSSIRHRSAEQSARHCVSVKFLYDSMANFGPGSTWTLSDSMEKRYFKLYFARFNRTELREKMRIVRKNGIWNKNSRFALRSELFYGVLRNNGALSQDRESSLQVFNSQRSPTIEFRRVQKFRKNLSRFLGKEFWYHFALFSSSKLILFRYFFVCYLKCI